MLKRKIEEKFLNWKNNRIKQALLVTGARQIGKTYSIRKFAKENFKTVIEINFLEDEIARKFFDEKPSIDRIIAFISTYSNDSEMEENTLLFLDEIQECKDPLTVIKFIVENTKFRLILSGSLLGVTLKNVKSVPVGYMDVIEMFPLDFEEFCLASGVGSPAITMLENCFNSLNEVEDNIHTKFLELFRFYLVVGGMPEAINNFISTHDIVNVRQVHKSIEENYKRDITRYVDEEKLNLLRIYDFIPASLNSQNKRFKISTLGKGSRYEKNENSFVWLKEAGVALPAFIAKEPTYPLKLSQSSNLMKLFLSDIGLLSSMYPIELTRRIISGDDDINFGGLYENVVAQELRCHGQKELYYYNSHKYGEVDFLTEINGEVVPVEVKSGKSYYKHSALNNLLEIPNYEINKSYILSSANLKDEGNQIYLPIYMVMFLNKEEDVKSFIAFPDLSGLID